MRRLLSAIFLATALWPAQAGAAGDGRTEPVKPSSGDHPLKELWSGYHFSPPEIRARQDSESDNPAMKLYGDGEALWKKIEGRAKKSCASCHGDAARAMKGAAARFPAFFKLGKKPLTIEGRINLCRGKFMAAQPLRHESKPMLALAIYVKRQSSGVPINVPGDGALAHFLQKGKTYYTARRGQLDISCAQCHEKYAGKRYRGVKLSQGHANGFPAYRESWKETGSLLRQVNQCLKRVRATPLKPGSDALTNLELYLAWRANGLEIETPAVRE